MKLIEFCIKYPVTVLVAVILAVLFGVISLFRLPLQMIPTVDRPEITVETKYQGAAPLEVEQEVTDRLEEKLNSVENVDEILSKSEEGKSTITLKFDWGVNKDVARLDVSEKLDLVEDLPEDVERPLIRAVNSDEETPIAWIIVDTDRDINEVWEEGDDVIKPRIERVGGVGAVWMFGGQDREVHVILDHQAMSARGISIAQVRDALLRENRNIKGGKIDEGKRQYLVRTMGQFTDLKQIEDTIIRQDARGITYLKDIAQVRFGYEDKNFAVRMGGKPTIAFGVLRRTGANTVEVMKRLKEELKSLNRIYEPKGIRLVLTYDETDYIYDALGLVTSNIWYGGLLAVAVLLLFLRSGSSVLIIGFAIPISIMSTFVILGLLGMNLNIVMLAGIAFAIGMVVDNSIVVLENIFRHRQMGKGRFQAALDGATEVWGAILASTLTTVVVFLPILFVKEEAGQLFRAIAIAISVAVLFSLVVSLTVVPMLSSRLLRGTEDQLRRGRFGRFLNPLLDHLDRFGGGFVSSVVGLLEWLRRSFARRLIAAGIITGLAIALAYLLLPPIDYLPQGNRNLIFAYIKTPPGLNIEERERIVAELERRFLEMKELKYIFGVVRTDFSLVGVLAKDAYKDQKNMRRIVAELQRRTFGIPGAKGIFVTQSPLFRRRFAFIGGTNIDIDIKGDDLDTIQQIAGRLQDSLKTLKEVNFVNTEFEVGSPELQISVDREKASNLGLSASEVGYVIETMVNGTLAGTFRERGKELDIRLKGPLQEITRTQDLDRILLHTPVGRIVRLSDVASVRSEIGPTKVEHVDLDRAIKLTVNIRGDIPLESAINLLNEKVVGPMRAQLPLGHTINVTGQAKDLDVTWNSIKWALLLALIVDYLLMCSLFESWLNPLIIMFSVPLAALGGILGVKLAHLYEPATKMDVITMLGFIILAGTVVNNAILIVHQSLNFLREGYEPQRALLESVRTRIRPIFMTTTTTVFGMLPLVISTGAGSELYRGLGAVVLGGLSLSTLFTLVLVPVLFSLWLDVREMVPILRKVPVVAQEEALSYLNGGEREVTPPVPGSGPTSPPNPLRSSKGRQPPPS